MLEKKALIVIDLINDIVSMNSKFAVCATHAQNVRTIKNTNRAIDYARKIQCPIIFVKVGFSKNYLEIAKNSPMFKKVAENGILKLGEWGTEFISELHVKSDDLIITKHRVNAFYQTHLELLLSLYEVNTVVLAGASTEGAIQATARDAHDRDYSVVILEDACAASGDEVHKKSIDTLTRIATITTVEEWITSELSK